MNKFKVALLVLVHLGLSFGCTKKNEIPTISDSSSQLNVQLSTFEKGKKIYQINCLSCHGPNPKIDAPIGPSVAGSSLELLEARVIFAKYPEGYKPKRATATMVAMPHLKDDLSSLYEYLKQ